MDIDEKVINSIIEYLGTKPEIYKYFDGTYKSQKYDLKCLLPIILYVLKNNISWRKVSDLKITESIHWNTVYKMHQKLIKYKIYEGTYSQLINKFYKKNKI
jgi:uncharacterized protein YeaC (DUF1315 family)